MCSAEHKKRGGGFTSPRHKRADLFTAIELTDDGTSCDETLRHFADELLRLGLVNADELFVSSYDIVHDREYFFFVGFRSKRR